MGDLYLINVQLEPCVRPSEVLSNALKAVQKGLEKKKGKTIFSFKVIGENRLIMVIQGDPDDPLEELNATCGSQVRVTTTPLRTYEEFAEKVLKVTDTKLTAPAQYNLDGEGKLYFMHFVVEYKDMKQKDFLDIWHKEALAALGVAKNKGGLALLKAVGQREVFAFIRSTESVVDDLSFNLPIMIENGNQVNLTVKAIREMK